MPKFICCQRITTTGDGNVALNNSGVRVDKIVTFIEVSPEVFNEEFGTSYDKSVLVLTVEDYDLPVYLAATYEEFLSWL